MIFRGKGRTQGPPLRFFEEGYFGYCAYNLLVAEGFDFGGPEGAGPFTIGKTQVHGGQSRKSTGFRTRNGRTEWMRNEHADSIQNHAAHQG